MALLIGIFILNSCQSVNSVTNEIIVTEENRVVESNNIGNNENNVKSSGNLLIPLEIPVNTKAEEIHYYREDYVELLPEAPHCISDGKNIYLLSSPDFYIMPVGTDEIKLNNIDLPEGMEICHYTSDSYGRIHLLIAARDNEEYFIWRLDGNYQVDKKIEISTYIETIQMPRWPRWFLVLDDGTYYIQWALEQDGIIVSGDGILRHRFTLDSLGIGQVRQVAVGKDDHIYIVHGNRIERRVIGKLDVDSCIIENENPNLYFPANEIFIAMSAGTDTNLLLLSMYSGIWAYDTESGIMENRVSISDVRSGLDIESEFWINLFLPDGRLSDQQIEDDDKKQQTP